MINFYLFLRYYIVYLFLDAENELLELPQERVCQPWSSGAAWLRYSVQYVWAVGELPSGFGENQTTGSE